MKLASTYGVLLMLLPGCFAGPRRVAWNDVVTWDAPGPDADRAGDDDLAQLEAGLADEARLTPILKLALARYPELDAARARVRAGLAAVPAAGRLPDPELETQIEHVPLARPWAFQDANAIMVGLRQRFTPPGARAAAGREAEAMARMAAAELWMMELDLIARVTRAYYAYYIAAREIEIHLDHIELTTRVLELARVNYQVGRATQQDIFKVSVEISRMRNDVAILEQDRRAAAALLNTFMARRAGAVLGPVPAFGPPALDLDLPALEAAAAENRPEIAEAREGVNRSQAMLDMRRTEASWPMFMVGADYMLMPGEEHQHGYALMFSMNLPWLNPQRDEQVNEAEELVSADRRAVEAARLMAVNDVNEAYARHQAARASYDIIERDVLPQARQSFEAAQSAFATGNLGALEILDALRSLLDVRIEHARALAALETTLADLERAVGTSLRPAPATQGATP